jgi:glucose/arabinose dehydrogenase
MRAGYCAGLVATQRDGLVFPRTIVQVPGSNLFVVADMGVGWSPGRGRLLLLDPAAAEGQRTKVLLAGLDLPHGLVIGIDGRVYTSVVDKVFRFDPLASDPKASIEVIVQGLPGLLPRLSDGTRLTRNSFHPLKPFVFDKMGRIFINIGAPNDSCATRPSETKACAATEGDEPLASIWAFTPPPGGIFPALKPRDPNPRREIFALGLRNSMALTAHPRFPEEGFAFLQAENGRDLPELNRPNEEFNVIAKGRHYGWPYCYDLTTESPEYRAFLKTRTRYQNFCRNGAEYQKPFGLLPPHAAPLSMFYYQGEKFPELKGKLVVGWHGYRPTGSRIVFYEVDEKGFPKISPAPVRYNVSCANPPTMVFRTENEGEVPAPAFTELVSQWHAAPGIRPQGAPVGMTVASDGALWVVEDKNQSIIRLDVDPTASTTEATMGCNSRTEAQIAQLIAGVTSDRENHLRLSQVRSGLVEKHCRGCHSNFGIDARQTDAQKDQAVLRFILSQDGWIYPGDPEGGILHRRVWGTGPERIMPTDGNELLAGDPSYRKLVETLDALVAQMKPRAAQPAKR